MFEQEIEMEKRQSSIVPLLLVVVLAEAAETAIFFRFQSLVNSPDGHIERDALTDAVRTLRTIQTEKLHYPDWKVSNL